MKPITEWSKYFCELMIHSYTMMENKIDSWECFNYILDNILKITGSEYGMICKIDESKNDKYPILVPLGITNISWTNEMNKNWGPDFLSFKLDHTSLLSEPIFSKKIIITNDPLSHPSSSGLMDKKHPPVNSYIGCPILSNGTVIGFIGLANKENGYDESVKDHILYLASLFVSMIQIYNKSYDDTDKIDENEIRFYTSMFIPTQELIDIMSNGIAILDRFQRVYAYNREFAKTVKNANSDLSNAKILSIFPHFHDFFMLDKDSIKKEILFTNSDQKIQNVLNVSIHAIYIYKLKFYIMEIHDKTQEIEGIYKKLSERDYYLSVLNHDIRNPLQSIMMSSYILTELGLSSSLKTGKHIDIIYNSSKQMKNIIDNMQDLINLDNNSYSMTTEIVNINDIINNSVNYYKNLINHKKIYINVKSSVDVVTIEANKYTKIFNNLFRVSISNTLNNSILIKVKIVDNNLCTEIRDGGSGFSADELNDIRTINSNYMYDKMNINNTFGSVIVNVSIAKKLINILDGTFTIDSIKGKGSRIYFTIPIKENLTELSIPKNLVANILIVDDNIDNIIVLSDIIESISHEFNFDLKYMTTSDGYDAIEKAKNYPFDIILLDINMEEIDGFQTAKILRKDNGFTGAIIAFTGNILVLNEKYNLYDDYVLFTHVLNKPVERKELLKAIINFYNKS